MSRQGNARRSSPTRTIGRAGIKLALALLLTPFLLAMWPQALRAQQPALPAELKPNPILALKAFEPPAETDYELGAGDDISISIAGRPELDAKRTIGPDGRITLPLAGTIALTGKTREQAAAAVESALAPFYSRLSAVVGVDKYTSNRILLLGAVRQPGIVSFDRPPSLLEVVTRGGVLGTQTSEYGGSNYSSGGGSGGGGGGSSQAQNLPAVPDRCAIYRGADKVLWVDLKSLLETGSPLADLRLKRGDIVYVPAPTEKYVSVLGQVQHPGALILDSNTTLAKLLAESGGLTELAGRYPDIQIIQPSTGVTRVISFKNILQPGALDLTLRSGDVIFVPESGFNRATYVLQRISPLVTLFTAAALFQH